MKEQLLRKPISELVLEAEELQVQNLYKKSQLQSNSSSLQSGVLIESLAHEQGLWVEKYKPRNFSQLLSPETINREVLRSLKQWDRYVFKKKPSKEATDDRQHSNSYRNNKFDAKDAAAENDAGHEDDNSDNEEVDAKSGDPSTTETAVKDSRPKQRIILLSGPPGRYIR